MARGTSVGRDLAMYNDERDGKAASSPSRKPSMARGKVALSLPTELSFLAVGRIQDAVTLAYFGTGGPRDPAALSTFGRLLVAAKSKLKDGQRTRLENEDESVFLVVDPNGVVMAAVTTKSGDYPDETAYQLLMDFLGNVKKLSNLESVAKHSLIPPLEPMMRELFNMYKGPYCKASGVDSTMGYGQRLEVEYEGRWYPALLQQANQDGTFRVLYYDDNSYEDVDREYIRVLSKPPPGEDDILFAAIGKVEGAEELAHLSNKENSEVSMTELFHRLLAAASSKLRPGQRVALANGGGGSVFCSGKHMASLMTATCFYPELSAYTMLQDLLGAVTNAELAGDQCEEELLSRTRQLFLKYDTPFGGIGPEAPAPEVKRPVQAKQRKSINNRASWLQPRTSLGAEQAKQAAARLAQEEVRIKAEEITVLQEALASADLDRLSAAIKRAEQQGVPADNIAQARKVLEFETAVQKQVDELEKAIKLQDLQALKTAITKAEDLMNGVRKDQKKAAASRKMSSGTLLSFFSTRKPQRLDDALERAKEVYEAQVYYLKVAEDLRKAMNIKDVERLKKAIAAAEEVNMPQEIIEKAKYILEEQTNLLNVLKNCINDPVAFARFVDVDRNDMDAMQNAKRKFRDAMPLLVQLGAPADMIDRLEHLRKQVHNKIQDMKGSIRVFCRIRPLSKKEKADGDEDIFQRLDSMTVRIYPNPGKASFFEDFTFDSVFLPDSTQEQVFEDSKDLVQSALDGYNVALFAYGQTGSGKTYTMSGCPGQEGIAPRAIDELFLSIERRKARFDVTVAASMLELYNQELVDLLGKGVTSSETRKKLKIQTDLKTGSVNVEGSTIAVCQTGKELQDLLAKGMKNRSVAATAMNSASSRSHLILTIFLKSIVQDSQEQITGKLMIVDLAGSERLKKSMSTGAEQKEGIEINRSLTALGDVISGLTSNHTIIPYRNHPLTMLMQDVLGGSAKTLMFVNCSPATSNMDETYMSLKYATRAKKITNKVKKMDMDRSH
eukprot:CAMPEP_0206433522 /NCGR_PEP_ID=MMETSP0324_2-20121206/8579_1 /ASSEMBLY_ACC=CAM_ASM_000836 /TAXON_ID=2866 /ORGANISM="Crypthecodinium cohnii, Strain Seligo" /LENGTH=1009 /DNA_ID=CAMNT_0053899795 /DNA_START=7 /DNA_END=3038 /DNA_ORIENTATION=-